MTKSCIINCLLFNGINFCRFTKMRLLSTVGTIRGSWKVGLLVSTTHQLSAMLWGTVHLWTMSSPIWINWKLTLLVRISRKFLFQSLCTMPRVSVCLFHFTSACVEHFTFHHTCTVSLTVLIRITVPENYTPNAGDTYVLCRYAQLSAQLFTHKYS